MKNKIILHCFDSIIILVLTIALVIALIFQITYHEQPCQLCLMQRMGFYLICFGLVLNLIKEQHIKHYLLVIIAALFNSLIALAHVLFWIVPNSGSDGSAVFGFHMYSLNFAICVMIIIYSVLAGLITSNQSEPIDKIAFSSKLIIGLLMLTLCGNIVSVKW